MQAVVEVTQQQHLAHRAATHAFFESRAHECCQLQSLPLPLKPGEFTRTYMVVPEDLRGADISVSAEVRVDFTGLAKGSTPTILFGSANFGPQTNGEDYDGVRRFKCKVPLQAISQGKNRVMVKVADEGAKLAGAELWIRR